MILTKEKRELLITSCQNDIAYYDDRILLADNEFDRGAFKLAKLKTEIALSALTAEPCGVITEYTIEKVELCEIKASEFKGQFVIGAKYPDQGVIYNAHPVQVVKFPLIDDVPYSGSKEYDDGYKDGAADVIESIKKLNNIEG